MPKRRKPLTLEQVRAALSENIEMLRHYIVKPHEQGLDADIGELCKLSHALAQLANTYRGLSEATALEELDELRDQIAEIRDASRETQIRA